MTCLTSRADGDRTCQRFGPLLLVAPTLVENWVHALVATGRWDDAERLADELQQQWKAEGIALAVQLLLAQIAAARGDGTSFRRYIRSTSDSRIRTTHMGCTTSPLRMRSTCSGRAEADKAYRLTREALDHLVNQQDAGLVVSLCSVALRAHADLVTSGTGRVIRDSAIQETSLLLSIAEDAARNDPGALGRTYLLLCEAEAARASMTPSADKWNAVVAEWQRLGCPYSAAYAQWRLAEELFGGQARTRGTRALAEALRTATALGCAPLEAALRTLARHAGVSPDALEPPLEASVPPESEAQGSTRLPVPLTKREFDVLRLLTEGYSNQQIARRLFISESTASVHVSRIIAKLGVSNRLQAATAAQRMKLFPSEADVL